MAGYDFKSEDDVKLYLKNLLTEYQFGCYGEKNPEVCHLLGDYMEAIKVDINAAADIYKKNCDNLDYGRSCAKFGGYALAGKGCEKDVHTAFKYMKRGCELDDSIGCTNAGILATTNKLIQKEDDRVAVIQNGVKMLERACNNHKAERACFLLAGMYMSGIKGAVDRNLVECYKYNLKACEYENPRACANIAQMHARGEGAQKNLEMAETFRKRAIDLESQIKRHQEQIKFGQGISP